jgi:transcriptional regulator with XRE-family HTH domain
MSILGERLKELRTKRKLTQEELAKELVLGQYTISDWENERSNPDLESICYLARFFGVTTDYLLGISQEQGRLVNEKFATLTEDEQVLIIKIIDYIKLKKDITKLL